MIKVGAPQVSVNKFFNLLAYARRLDIKIPGNIDRLEELVKGLQFKNDLVPSSG